MKYIATVDNHSYLVDAGEAAITLEGVPVEIDLQSIDGGFHYSLLVNRTSHEVFVERCEDICFVTLEGQRYRVQVEDERAHRLGEQKTVVEEAGEVDVVSPMPGVVVAVLAKTGQKVQTGEGLLILEAMKMENEICAPRTGVVGAIRVEPGQRVSQDDVLVRIGL